jgi:SAM-dependent methyltransferase
MSISEIISLLTNNPQLLIKCVLSKHWSMRPIMLKSGLVLQITRREGAQELHQNFKPAEAWSLFLDELSHSKQAQIYTQDADYQILQNRKGLQTVLKKPPSQTIKLLEHNRTKQYILPEGEPLAFLVELGIMNSQGRVYPQKRDKFIQINKFLEIISHLPLPEELHIADLGCGKAYLTFALYHYLTVVMKRQVTVYGCDFKKQVMDDCTRLAETMHYKGLFFECGSIEDFNPPHSINMVVALHACNTATDDALIKALNWDAKIILAAPCCHQELRPQIESEKLKPLLKHGIFKEHFAALVTDAARAQFLETRGYSVDAIEFVDPEHTPKNILLKAVKDVHVNREKALEIYAAFRRDLNFTTKLDRLKI